MVVVTSPAGGALRSQRQAGGNKCDELADVTTKNSPAGPIAGLPREVRYRRETKLAADGALCLTSPLCRVMQG